MRSYGATFRRSGATHRHLLRLCTRLSEPLAAALRLQLPFRRYGHSSRQRGNLGPACADPHRRPWGLGRALPRVDAEDPETETRALATDPRLSAGLGPCPMTQKIPFARGWDPMISGTDDKLAGPSPADDFPRSLNLNTVT